MYWYENLYLSKSVSLIYKRRKKQIIKQHVHPMVFLINLPENKDSLLEIIPSGYLLQKKYPTDSLRIVGMAGSRREALAMLETIISDVYAEDETLNVESFFEQRASEGYMI